MKGFYSTIIVIAMLGLLISFSNLSTLTSKEINSFETDLIILENASMQRVVMENNVDRIIELKLIEQLKKENFNLILIQTQINSSLFNYLKNRAHASDLFFENTTPITIEYLMLNSSAFLLEVKGIRYAEYAYTSTPLLDSIVSSKFGKDSILHFKIPIGYTKRVVG